MKNILSHPQKSLAAKLIIAIGLLMVIGSFIFWYAILQKQEKDLSAIAVRYGGSLVNFIKEVTRDSMIATRRHAIQQTLEDISLAEGVERVRIFDHKGKISFSTFKEDIGKTVEKDSLSCRACHSDTEKSYDLLQKPRKNSFYKAPEGFTALKLVEPVYNESSCYASKCHVHSREQKIIGFIEADTSLTLLDEAKLKQELALTAYVIIFIVAISVSLGLILYKIVSKPVSELTHGMEKISAGDFSYSVPITSEDEMGTLAKTFNSMIKDIKEARDQREVWTQTLEAEIEKKTEEIQRTHAGLVQTEKLASLGRMAAGVAHEINSPLTGIITFAYLMKKSVPPDSRETEDLNVIIEQAERCSKIIKNLLTFARVAPSEKGKISINNVLAQTIYMVKNQEKFHNVKFNINMDESDFTTLGDASQFQQIFLNMIINAADAMNGRGTITIATGKITMDDKPCVEVAFSDTGCGIPEENLSKLFEPFFTTKPVGKGTGLGLSVSHGIVKHHGGQIEVKSTVGTGTTFFIKLVLTEEET